MNIMTSIWAGLPEVAKGALVTRLLLRVDGTVVDERVVTVRKRWGAQRQLVRAHGARMMEDFKSAHEGYVGKISLDGEPAGYNALLVYVFLYLMWRVPMVVGKALVTKLLRAGGWWPNVWHLYSLKGDVVGGGALVAELLPQPRGEARADPFLVGIGGKFWLLFEAFTTRKYKGVLMAAEWQNGRVGEARLLLERAHHVSYPHVVELNGKTYLIPETHAAGHVELLPCALGADGWPVVEEPEKLALEGQSCADATLWRDEMGEVWLLVNISRTSLLDHSVELHVFRLGNGNFGKLVPHANNPVVRDCRFARNAGPIFKDKKGRIVRPCQAYEGGMYGTQVHFMQIKRLSDSVYEEECVGSLKPDFAKGLNGLHHVCRVTDDTFVVDVRVAWERSR